MNDTVKPAVKPEVKKAAVAAKAPTMNEMLAQSKKIDQNIEKEMAARALAELKAKAGA